MASQDERVFHNPDEWQLRGMNEYMHSLMFADPALQNGDNLAPHSHACPAKDLAIDILTRFLKHFSRHAWTVSTTDIFVSEYNAANVHLTKQVNTDCASEQKAGRRCIVYVADDGRVVEAPSTEHTAFDGECFTRGQPQPWCIAYNRGSWVWGVMAIYVLIFLSARVLWKLPLVGFLVYTAFRVLETINSPLWLTVFLGNPLYAVAMYWGRLCFSSTSWPRSVGLVCASVVAFYGLLIFTLEPMNALVAYQASFLPFYFLSLRSLWANNAKIWCIGLAWGWLGPLLIVLSGMCSNADATVFGRPFASNASGECIYSWLMFSDGLITFPLAFVGQLIVSFRDTAPITHAENGTGPNVPNTRNNANCNSGTDAKIRRPKTPRIAAD